METLLLTIGATLLISLGALAGVVTLALQEERLNRILLFLVSLSAGALMGGAFLHLLPEAAEQIEGSRPYLLVLFAFIFFFLVEKLLHWRHCHDGKCDVHTFGYMNLFGDSIHNFIDGLIIAATFLVDIRLGLITSLAVALHEIPQEIGDFGVLLYAGFKKEKALLVNFLVALTVVIGGIVGHVLAAKIQGLIPYLLAFAAGGFLYVAASDLIPEIRKETSLKKSVVSFGVFLLGVSLMFLIKLRAG